MPDLVVNQRTVLPPEEVMVRAVQFFTTESWRAQSQSNRIATFVGVPKIPWARIFLMIFLYFCFVVPGLIYQFSVMRRLRRLQNIVVTTTPAGAGCDVVVSYPKHAARLARGFLAALPQAQAAAGA